MVQYIIAGFAELIYRKDLRRGQPSREGDDIGLFSQFKQLTDHRTASFL